MAANEQATVVVPAVTIPAAYAPAQEPAVMGIQLWTQALRAEQQAWQDSSCTQGLLLLPLTIRRTLPVEQSATRFSNLVSNSLRIEGLAQAPMAILSQCSAPSASG